jgi:tRNA 2-thiouridine synthesizing protein A
MIDARGRSCPEPVIMIKKAIASNEDNYTMLVDSRTALENVSRFVKSNGYQLEYTQEKDFYKLNIKKT